jgi:3-oxoacyl-[acyl-carrier-protein] synthase-3
MVVVCTFSGDYLFPPVATAIHRNLGLHASLTFDLQANCTGLVTGLTCASDRMRLDADLRFALVVGVEVLSPFVDWSDPQTAIYFSDGAGAVVLGRVPEGRGVQSAAFHTDSSNFESVRLRGGGSCLPFGREPPLDPDFGSWLLEMSGLATWRQAVTHLPPVARRACEKATLTPDQLDVLVFHQANIQIIHYVMRKMRLPVDRAFTNVERVGNAGAASMPIALSEAIACGKVGPGSKLLLAGVGAGFNFGASVWWMHDEFAPAADGEGKRS